MKLFPGPFMGIGANYRRLRAGANTYAETFGTSRYLYLVNNVTRWGNSTADLLQFGVPKVSA